MLLHIYKDASISFSIKVAFLPASVYFSLRGNLIPCYSI
jgi:hypothetical protein